MAVYKNEFGLYSCKGKYKNYKGESKYYRKYSGKSGFKKKQEALAVDIQMRKQLNESDVHIVAHQLTFEMLWEKYRKEKSRTLKYSTIYSDIKILKKAALLNDMLLKYIKSKTIQQILDEMDKDNYSLNYIKRLTDTLHKIFKYAVEKEIISINPVTKIIKITRPNELKKDNTNFWEKDEFDSFIKNVEDSKYYTYFTFAYFMGCRRGEMLALQWQDVNMNRGTVRINKTCNQTTENDSLYILTPPKTKNSVRTIKMPKKVVELLEILKINSSNMYEFNDEWFVFGGYEPLRESTMQRHLTYWLKQGNYDGYCKITMHGFRHSHASYLINNGANIKASADRLGDTVEQVLKTYSHLFLKTENELVALLEM